MFCWFFCIFCLYKLFGVTNMYIVYSSLWTIKHFKILQVITVVTGFVWRCSLLFLTYFSFFKYFSECSMSKIYHINNKSKPWLPEQRIKFYAKSRSIIIEGFIAALRMLSNYWIRFFSDWHTPFWFQFHSHNH